MAKHATNPIVDEASEAVIEIETASISEQATEGVRARRAFMPKQFVPSPDWINANIVAQGKGTRATLGRVFGVCLEVKPKVLTLPDGSKNESLILCGQFQAENYMTGELSEASNAYLPMAYAEKVANVFKLDESIKVCEIDVDIGLEATGKTIPYEWVVTAYREGAEMAVLRRLRNSRKRPENILVGAAGKPLPLLTKSA